MPTCSTEKKEQEMSIFIDSAIKSEVIRALEMGYVAGVTTNPLLMAKQPLQWRKALSDICDICRGPVYYQIDTTEERDFESAAMEIAMISRGQVIIKLPASPAYFKLASKISDKVDCCMTAVYSDAQLIAAAAAGAKHVAVYVSRISKFHAAGDPLSPVDGISAIESMRNAIDRSSLDLRILAASLKSSAECSEAMAAGAHDITASADVLGALAEHPLSEKALNDFESAIRNRN